MPEMPPGFTSCKIKKNKIKYKKNQRKNVHYTDIEIVYFFLFLLATHGQVRLM
jgi:hypothetical protein